MNYSESHQVWQLSTKKLHSIKGQIVFLNSPASSLIRVTMLDTKFKWIFLCWMRLLPDTADSNPLERKLTSLIYFDGVSDIVFLYFL